MGREFDNKCWKNFKSPHHALPPCPPPPPNTPFKLIGSVVHFQLTGTRGKDIWPQMVHFCLGLTIIWILINFDIRHYQEVTNRYFRYSIKINSNQSKSIKIYRLISKIDGNRSVEFLWLSISAIKRLILSILIEKYRKDKNRRSQVGWFVFLLCLVHHHLLELINSNSKLILKSINISITLRFIDIDPTNLYVTTGYAGVLHELKSIGSTTIRAIM